MSEGFRTVFGASSSRPELGCPTVSTIQHLDDREWKINLHRHLELCADVIYQEANYSEALKEAGLCSTETPFLFQLEKTLLDIAAPSLSDGTFYCSFFQIENNFYCRFFESGVLSGYFLDEGLKHIKAYLQDHGDEISQRKFIWWQVSTPEDIIQYHERYTKRLERKRSHKSNDNPATESGKRYMNLLTRNKSSIINAHRHLLAKAQTLNSEEFKFLGSILNVIKKSSHKETNLTVARHHDATGVFHGQSHTWENSIEQFRINGTPVNTPPFSELMDAPPRSSHFTWHEKCTILSTIPNNHYWDEIDHAHIGYARMLSIRDEIGKKKPASLRNLILLHFREKNISALNQYVRKFKTPNSQTLPTFQPSVNPNTHHVTDQLDNAVEDQPRRRRRALTEEDILRNLTFLNPTLIEENKSTETTLYHKYRTAQIESGTLKWRVHKPDVDIVCLNDIDMNNGNLLDFSYVHLTRTLNGNGRSYTCTCKLYATLLQIATLNDNLDNTVIYDVNIKCCHIRLFQELIEPNFDTLFTEESFQQPSKYQKVLKESLETLQKPIFCLPSSLKTHKYSVVADENDPHSCNFVHLSKTRLFCQSGECEATYGYSKRKIVYLDETTNLCPHLDLMKKKKTLWLEFIEGIGEEEEDEDDQSALPPMAEDDEDLVEIFLPENPVQNEVFNETTGLWDFPSLSTHRPLPSKHPHLMKTAQSRLSVFPGVTGIREENGYLTGESLMLYPQPPSRDCPCGAGYFNDVNPEGRLSDVRYRPTVYLTNCAAKYVVRDRECLAGNPECLVEYSGEESNIHFFTKETAAGDEIGWQFIDHALNTHITFTSFCKIMSLSYSRFNNSSAKFMSVQTFISWWFSWSSKFKIDFRQQCHICKSNPKFLACDGTKIGISFRHANVVPIETPEQDAEVVDPCHRRNDRAFLRFHAQASNENIRRCRDHLAYMSNKQLGKISANSLLDFRTETDRTQNLINTVDIASREIIHRFCAKEYPDVMLRCLAIIFKGLSSDHSLSAFIPFRYTDIFMSILNELENDNDSRLNTISEFAPEFRDVLSAAKSNRNNLMDAVSFFQYLVSRVQEIKQLNRPVFPAHPQPGSYNPTKNGVAYYFTPSGEKLRDLPNYTMNDNAHSKNYDDPPARASEQCNKIYPEVSRKGTTYLFLWFDPKHYGHCYGFHIIPGSEGRKDPFTSAYCYLEEAPEEVFYDFCCQFEEYCLNREPGFWENTRFWHDLFHGFSHKCPYCYKSQRLAPLHGLNTEICEQFNSFIQKIKYSARSMTLAKFCYYLQFMIYQWCEMKKEAFDKRCGIAAAFLE